MSVINLLKEDYLFEDEYSPYIGEQPGIEEIKGGKEPLNKEFSIKLCNYLEHLFPGFGTFDSQILNELRNYIDETDNKLVKKTKEKIHGIILDEKKKFLKRIQNRMERLEVVPKKEV
jgi:hypothetical protein